MTNKYKNYGGSHDPNPETKNNSELINSSDPFDKYSFLVQNNNKQKNEIQEIDDKNEVIPDISYTESLDKQINVDNLILDLDNLVGLNSVKYEIKALLNFVKVQDLRKQKNISNTKPSLHSVFYGSPGTGKTTVARLYGQILAAMGFLSRGHLVETDRAGLIGGYVGQTSIKTEEKIKEALGGILFIDEAYALSKGEEIHWDYGDEAIAILLKRMEDFRDDFVVIVAGYPEPMEKFLASNEGLRSRFSTFIHFDDYSTKEMIEIFKRICITENYILSEEAMDYVFTTIDYNYSIRDKSFGNARFVRNLFETVIKNHAIRISNTSNNPSFEELRLILPCDIPFVTITDTNVIRKPKNGR